MAETLGTWGALIRGTGVIFREFFSSNDYSQVNGWDPVVRTMSSDDLTTNFTGKTGSGLLQRFSDGSIIPTASRYKLYDTAATLEPYGERIEITRQTLLFRDFNGVFNENNDLIKSVKAIMSKAGAQIFNIIALT